MYFFKTYFKIFSFSVNVLGRISEKNILAESAFHSQLVCNCTCVCVFNKYGNIVYSINKGKRVYLLGNARIMQQNRNFTCFHIFWQIGKKLECHEWKRTISNLFILFSLINRRPPQWKKTMYINKTNTCQGWRAGYCGKFI